LRGAHDLNFLVDAGVYSLLYPDGSDVIPALQLADVFGGFYAAFRILVAWIQRVKMPQALHLTVPLTEGLERLTDYLQHESSVPLLPSLTGALARYRVYWTKDRKRIAVAALESKFFANFLEVLEIRGMERKNERDLAWQIQKRIGKKNLAEWKRIFREADACVSFIPSREEALKGSSKKYLRDPI
jgi:alpha-methylacyl-CoA racemase